MSSKNNIMCKNFYIFSTTSSICLIYTNSYVHSYSLKSFNSISSKSLNPLSKLTT